VNKYRIPFNKPSLEGGELEYLRQAVASGHISGDGEFTRKCHSMLETELGVVRALLTPSCTHALEMAAILLDVQPGDEVIVPSFTFVSTINAFVLRGARPVFADIDPTTLNIDVTRLEPLFTPRTRCLVPMHYAGVGCEMGALEDIAGRHRVPIVEDNAHGLFGRYRGRPLGSFGTLATLSFHETKNFSCGEGGALLINDAQYIHRAEIVREKGTDRSRFFRGEVDKYTWVDSGSSFLPSDLQAAYLYAQLEARERILFKRRRVWNRYQSALSEWARAHEVRLPEVPEHCEHPFHIFHLRFASRLDRQGVMAHLRSKGILSVFHYLPLHLSPMGIRFGGKPGDCPVTEDVSDRLLRLPLYNDLTPGDQDEVIAAVQAAPLG
jgi:dTDP-4-amino-4,6-dideoxygalactose transaminase